MSKFLTTAELADRLRTSPESCRYWKHISMGQGTSGLACALLYEEADVEARLDARRDADGQAKIA